VKALRNSACLPMLILGSILISSCGGGSARNFISTPVLSVSVSPASASIPPGGTQTLTATVTNDSASGGVNWSVSCSGSSCGAVSPTKTSSGTKTTYTAPTSISGSSLSVTVTASSATRPSVSSSAAITVKTGLPVVLPVGNVQLGSTETCPSGMNFATGMTCYSGTVTNCPNAEDLGFVLGYQTPGTTPNGTIVLLPGAGGQVAGPGHENAYAADYRSAGYAIVELAWDSDWEDATNGMTGSGVPAHNIQAAACRPATILNYIFTQNSPFYTSGGRCAQGFSGGSGAIGYALASYGADAYLDKVELQSGPVFGDIQQGCEVPPAPNVNVCTDSSGSAAAWCKLGSQAPWSDSPAYIDSPLLSVQSWTGDSSCGGASPTSSASNASWKAMSIVDGTSGPNFDYSNTLVTGWLCASVASGSGSMNNSTAQGQFFYEQVGATSTSLTVYAVQNCNGPEGVDVGTVPALSNGTETGYNATLADMSSGTNACHKTH